MPLYIRLDMDVTPSVPFSFRQVMKLRPRRQPTQNQCRQN
jgi:hypothetical protein